MKRTYTFEMWLKDEPFHEKSAPLPEDYPFTAGLNRGEINEYIRNSIGGLIDEGFLYGEEQKKVEDYMSQAYRTALEIFSGRVDDYVERYLNSEYKLQQITADKRLNEIDLYLTNEVDETLYSRVIRGDNPQLECSGPICANFVNTKDITQVMPYLFNSNLKPPIATALPTYHKHPCDYLLLYIILKERTVLLEKMGRLNLSSEAIRDKYEQFTKEMSHTKAADAIHHWLFHELNLTQEYLRDEIKISVNPDSLRQYLIRERKKMRQ